MARKERESTRRKNLFDSEMGEEQPIDVQKLEERNRKAHRKRKKEEIKNSTIGGF